MSPSEKRFSVISKLFSATKTFFSNTCNRFKLLLMLAIRFFTSVSISRFTSSYCQLYCFNLDSEALDQRAFLHSQDGSAIGIK